MPTLVCRQKLFILVLISALFALNTFAQTHHLQFKTTKELKRFFKWKSNRIPMISAHRGGPAANFPENCIETFEHTTRQTYSVIECDIVETKDGELVMMHDATLDRTTTGTGNVSDYTLAQLQDFYLEDNQGQATNFRIPTLAQVMEWAHGKVILMLDIKKGISPEKIVQVIRKYQAENYAMVITYTMQSAVTYHQLNKDLMLSVTIRNEAELSEFSASRIPTQNVVVFTGVGEVKPAVLKPLHDLGISTILGTMGKADKQALEDKGLTYKIFYDNGIDMLSGDNPALMASILFQNGWEKQILKSKFRRHFVRK
jgi:glycerophosphoryl diester phosphodiesterase